MQSRLFPRVTEEWPFQETIHYLINFNLCLLGGLKNECAEQSLPRVTKEQSFQDILKTKLLYQLDQICLLGNLNNEYAEQGFPKCHHQIAFL